MTGDGDGVGVASTTAGFDKADSLGHSAADTAWTVDLIDNDAGALVVDIIVVVVMVMMVERVADTVGSTPDATAQGEVTTVVVVTHVSVVLSIDFDIGFDSYVCDRATAFVLDVVGGVGAAAVVSLSDVELVLNDSVVVLAAVVFDVDGVADPWRAVVTDDTIAFFVDSDVVSVAAAVVSDIDVDFFLGKSSILPSARGATTKFDFPFYLCAGDFFGRSVTPVR